MHRQFDDRFDAIDLGVRTVTYAHQIPSTPSPSPTPGTKLFERTVAGPDRSTKTLPVTPTDQVKEAVKDGAITAKEKTAFDRAPAATGAVLKDEQKRLTDAVKQAQGDDLARDDSGRVKLEGGKPVVNPGALLDRTEHEQRVKSLAETRDTGGLDKIDDRFFDLKDAGATVGLEAVKEQRGKRVDEEAKVVDVVKDKLALVGTLEADKLTLDAGASALAKDDYQALRTEAQKYIEQFNANGGQFYEGNDWFGDDWDTATVDFDKLASRFHEDPDKLKEFADVQGQDDDHLQGKSTAQVGEYLTSLHDSEEATKIALRYQAAQELQGIFGRYNSARDAVDGEAGRIAALDAEIGYLNSTIELDLAALSPETIEAVEEHVTPIAGIIEESTNAPTTPSETKPVEDRPAKTNPNVPSGAPDAPSGTESTPKRATVDIDYSTPEQRQQVLTRAQQQNLLPEQAVSFDERGQAVYTVQPGDSYWRIADMSDGTAPHEFDSQHFSALVTSNSERLGRDPQVGIIHPDDQVVIQGRSVDELVKLLGLPLTQDAPVETPAPERRSAIHAQPI